MNGATVTADATPLWMRLVFGRNPRNTLVRLIGVIVVSLVLFRFILIPIRVSGLSMYPTYRDGKVNVVNHQAYRWHKPQRGDIIAFRSPEDGNLVLLKRIVALPGETVSVVQGRALVNGQFLEEPYANI